MADFTHEEMNLRKLYLMPAFLSVYFFMAACKSGLVTNWLQTTSEVREYELKTMVEMTLESL